MLTNGLLMAFQQLPVGVLTIVVTLVFMFALNPAIAAVVALLTPISIFTARFIATHSARHFSGQTRLRGELTAYVEEMVGGISAIETFDMAGTRSTRALPRRTRRSGRRASRRCSSRPW